MAHVINLVTQAFMGTVSTSKHYDPATPEVDLVSTAGGDDRDVIGIICAITVKVSTTESRFLFHTMFYRHGRRQNARKCSKASKPAPAHCISYST